MPQLKVDEIAESTTSAGVTLANNTTLSGTTTLTTGTGLTTCSGNLQVDGTTSLNGATNLNSNALSGVTSVAASGTVTCAGVNAGGGTIQTTGSASTGALTCSSLTVGSTPFSVNLKAFGELSFAATSNDNPTVTTGDYNIATCTHNASSNTIVISFSTAMSGSNYIPLVTFEHDANSLLQVTSMSKSTTALTIVYAQKDYSGSASTIAVDVTMQIAVLEL